MKQMDWLKWVVATVVASISMTVSALSYLDSNYSTKENFLDIEKRLDRMESHIYDELKQIKEMMLNEDRKSRHRNNPK